MTSEDRDNSNKSNDPISALTGGSIVGKTVLPATTFSDLAKNIQFSVDTLQGFSAILSDKVAVMAVVLLDFAGNFRFDNVPAKEGLLIDIRQGRIHLKARIYQSIPPGQAVSIEVNTRSTAEALLIQEVQSQNSTFSIPRILANTNSIESVKVAIETELTATNATFTNPLITVLQTTRVNVAVVTEATRIIKGIVASATTTTTTSSTSTTTGTPTTTQRPVVVLSPITQEQKGEIAVNYTLADADSTGARLDISYSVNNGNFLPATVNGLLASSPASVGGTAGAFTWLSLKNIPDINSQQVRLRAVATDNFGAGPASTIGPFTVLNLFKKLFISDFTNGVHEFSASLVRSSFATSPTVQRATGMVDGGGGQILVLDATQTAPKMLHFSAVGQLISSRLFGNSPFAGGVQGLTVYSAGSNPQLIASDISLPRTYFFNLTPATGGIALPLAFKDLHFDSTATGYGVNSLGLFQSNSASFPPVFTLKASVASGNLSLPQGIFSMDSTFLAVADAGFNKIFKFSRASSTLSLLSSSSSLNRPQDSLFTNSGNLMVLNGSDVVILNLSTGAVSSLIGTAQFPANQSLKRMVVVP